VNVTDYAALFYPGGHGPLWDLASSAESIALIEAALAAKKPVAAVCHGPAVLLKAAGAVKGRRVTGFSNSEEAVVGLSAVVPFSLEDSLVAAGGVYSRVGDWAPHVEVDGDLVVTGQNPQSSGAVVRALLGLLQRN
jgi:putative intracellular protease/amidase